MLAGGMERLFYFFFFFLTACTEWEEARENKELEEEGGCSRTQKEEFITWRQTERVNPAALG